MKTSVSHPKVCERAVSDLLFWWHFHDSFNDLSREIISFMMQQIHKLSRKFLITKQLKEKLISSSCTAWIAKKRWRRRGRSDNISTFNFSFPSVIQQKTTWEQCSYHRCWVHVNFSILSHFTFSRVYFISFTLNYFQISEITCTWSKFVQWYKLNVVRENEMEPFSGVFKILLNNFLSVSV